MDEKEVTMTNSLGEELVYNDLSLEDIFGWMGKNKLDATIQGNERKEHENPPRSDNLR